MRHLRYRWKQWITITVVLVFLATGMVISCGRGDGGGGLASPSQPETGTVVITGRIF